MFIHIAFNLTLGVFQVRFSYFCLSLERARETAILLGVLPPSNKKKQLNKSNHINRITLEYEYMGTNQ
ncbi:MAG: hypothetical protein KTM48_01075 [Wolbachia endosymbiont of Pissodes strobi]|nr:hypothetical protein [Wolbachia endosymbiont of Pissodes strobi]